MKKVDSRVVQDFQFFFAMERIQTGTRPLDPFLLLPELPLRLPPRVAAPPPSPLPATLLLEAPLVRFRFVV
jgi:hypothetical protein